MSEAEKQSDVIYYTVNDYYNMESEGSLHILSHFKTIQQQTQYSCGATVALMVLTYYGIETYDEPEICELAGTNPLQGTTTEGLITFFEDEGYELDYHADAEPIFDYFLPCEEFLIELIDEQTPMIVQWEDWGGHWQVIIGIDTCDPETLFDDVLIMADPMDITDHSQDGYYVVPFARFFYMWREGALNDKDDLYEQPYIIVQRPE